MSEAKRYRVDAHRTVWDAERPHEWLAEASSAWDAERIARLLNAEEAVRAALQQAAACFGPADAPEAEAFWVGEYEDAVADERQPNGDESRARVIAKVRAALSALDAEAVRP